MKYYSEAISKDSNFRKDYLDSIDYFIENKRQSQLSLKEQYINPTIFMENQEKYRNDFVDMLGFPLNEKRGAKLKYKQFVAKDKNVNIYRMQLQLDCGIIGYGMYFEQTEKKKPFALCFHGGLGTPELISSINMDSANYNHLARRLTDRGINVFCPQFLLWSVKDYGNEYDRQKIDSKLKKMGGSITALELFVVRHWLDYFENEDIDKLKMGVAGMSYGGMNCLYLSAIDKRLKIALSESWVCDNFYASQQDWSYKDEASHFGVAEIGALTIPRKLFVTMGNKDELFNGELTDVECKKIKEYFSVCKVKENFDYRIFDGNHEVDRSDIAIDWFVNKLSE